MCISSFFIVQFVLPQWVVYEQEEHSSALASGRAGQSWEKLSFLRPVLHVPKAYWGVLGGPVPSRSNDPSPRSRQNLPCSLQIGMCVVGRASFLYKKSSFTEFLEVFCHDWLET